MRAESSGDVSRKHCEYDARVSGARNINYRAHRIIAVRRIGGILRHDFHVTYPRGDIIALSVSQRMAG